MTTVGFVGLGTMGGAIVRRLLARGETVIGYNRSPARATALAEAGMLVAGTPREAASRSEVCFTMVSDSAALDAVVHGRQGLLQGLAPGGTFIDMSTVDPTLVKRISEEVRARGARMLDAPVSGSVGLAESGQLTLMVGGERSVLEEWTPLLLGFAKRATWVGGPGQGTLMKIAMNLQVYVQTVAFAESMRLAHSGGVDPRIALEVLLNSAIASPMLQYRAPFMLERPATPWFTVALSLKDLRLAVEQATDRGVPLPTARAAAAVFARAVAKGMSQEEAAAVYDIVSSEETG